MLVKMRQARLKSSYAAMERQPDLRTSNTRSTFHPRPGERYNWPAQRGLVSLTFVTIAAKRVGLVHWLPIRLSLHYNPMFVTIATLDEGQLRMELT